MNKYAIKSGTPYGWLTAIKNKSGTSGSRSIWSFHCDCGKIVNRMVYDVFRTKHKSCGCKKKPSKTFTHHMSKSRIYRIWTNMNSRCYDTSSPNYYLYGGRGIVVCKKWWIFENFYADMKHGYSDELSLDRINNYRGYLKSNCRWVTDKEQCRNRRNNVYIKIGKEIKCVSEWAEISKTSKETIRERLVRGYSPHECVWGIKNRINNYGVVNNETGEVYTSTNEAALKNGVSVSYLYRFLCPSGDLRKKGTYSYVKKRA